jgi:hypothetical protein
MTKDARIRGLCLEAFETLEALEPEGSVPLSGFSRELRGAPDAERFRFEFPLRGEALSPVHIVFSAQQRTAEVKTLDLKAVRLSGVSSVEEARRRWVEWWRSGNRKPGFVAPRRTGRMPAGAVR